MPFPPTFTNAWDTTQPPDTQLANLLGQDIRNLKLDVMQRLSLLSGTLANRPTPEILNAIWGGAGFGLLYFATDSSQIFQWNGAAWTDVTSSFISKSTLLNAQANQAALVGNSADQVFYTFNVPANAVPNLKALRVSASWKHLTGVAVVTYKVSLNGVVVFGGVNSVTNDSSIFVGTILNTGAATAVGSATFTFVGIDPIPSMNVIGAGLNWAGIQPLQITFNVANTDQITPFQWLVELIQ